MSISSPYFFFAVRFPFCSVFQFSFFSTFSRRPLFLLLESTLLCCSFAPVAQFPGPSLFCLRFFSMDNRAPPPSPNSSANSKLHLGLTRFFLFLGRAPFFQVLFITHPGWEWALFFLLVQRYLFFFQEGPDPRRVRTFYKSPPSPKLPFGPLGIFGHPPGLLFFSALERPFLSPEPSAIPLCFHRRPWPWMPYNCFFQS